MNDQAPMTKEGAHHLGHWDLVIDWSLGLGHWGLVLGPYGFPDGTSDLAQEEGRAASLPLVPLTRAPLDPQCEISRRRSRRPSAGPTAGPGCARGRTRRACRP